MVCVPPPPPPPPKVFAGRLNARGTRTRLPRRAGGARPWSGGDAARAPPSCHGVGAVFPSGSPCFSLRGCLARKDSLSSALRQGTHGKDSCLVEKTAAPVFHTLFPSETHFFSLMPDFPQNRPLFPSGPHSSSRQFPHARFPSESPSFSLRRLSCPRDTLTSAPTSSRHSVHPSASPPTHETSQDKKKKT